MPDDPFKKITKFLEAPKGTKLTFFGNPSPFRRHLWDHLDRTYLTVEMDYATLESKTVAMLGRLREQGYEVITIDSFPHLYSELTEKDKERIERRVRDRLIELKPDQYKVGLVPVEPPKPPEPVPARKGKVPQFLRDRNAKHWRRK